MRLKLNKCHKKITNIVNDFIEKYTTWLCKTYKIIKIKDLDIEKWKRNKSFSKHIQKLKLGCFKAKLQRKSIKYNSQIVLIDRYYQSSKICSCCGFKKKRLKLSERIYNCENCENSLDRDLNAAINIKNYISVIIH